MEQDIAKKHNRRVFPIYKGLAWDAQCYYAIIFLFLTQTKGLQASELLYAEAIYTIFLILFQIPATILIERIGSRKALVLGSILVTIQILMMMMANNFILLTLAYIISAFGYALKGISQYTLLYDSTKSKEGKKSFGNIDAKGAEIFYIMDSITAILAGFLFTINNYLPLIVSASIAAISILTAYRFEEVKGTKVKNTTIKEAFGDIKEGFKYITKSKRLRALLLFIAIFAGTLTTIATYERSLLSDLNVAPQYFGIIFAILNLLSAISSRTQGKIHNSFKNRTFAFVSLPIYTSFIVVGLVSNLNISYAVIMTVVFIGFFIQHFLKAPYWILNKKYITNFTNDSIRTKILATGEIIEGIGTSIIMFLAGLLLDYYNTATSYLIFGVIGIAIILIVLEYMRKRFGLRPEEYPVEDIKYAEVK